MIITKEIYVKWNSKNKSYYENLGYKYTKMKDSFLINISELPLGSNEYVKYECDYCGKKLETQYNYYNNTRNKEVINKDCCSDCIPLKMKEISLLTNGKNTSRSLDFNVIKEEYIKHNLILLDEVIINTKTPIKFICEKHQDRGEQTISYDKLKISKFGCKYCALESRKNKRKSNFEDVKKLYKYHNYNLLEYEYINTHHLMRYVCKEHPNIIQTLSYHDLKLGCGCEFCNMPRGELVIYNIFKNSKIKFKRQYTFDNCKNINKLRFDFGVFDNNKNILFMVEFHGKQHYEPIKYFGGEEKFKIQQKLDNIKEQYCKDNDIPLLIIPYWNFNNIEEILNKELKNYKQCASL